MAYSKQTWTDGVSEANAARLGHIEDGIADAAAIADAAQPATDLEADTASLVGSGGALDAALDAAYAPASFGGKVSVGPAGMATILGSPSLSLVNRTSVWKLDAATIEDVGGTLIIPDHWATAHVDLWWCNAGSGSGDVVLRVDMAPIAEGSAAPDAPSGTAATVTANGQNVVTKTRMMTSLAVTPGFTAFEVIRLADLAGDTLGNDIAVIGLVLTQAS